MMAKVDLIHPEFSFLTAHISQGANTGGHGQLSGNCTHYKALQPISFGTVFQAEPARHDRILSPAIMGALPTISRL